MYADCWQWGSDGVSLVTSDKRTLSDDDTVSERTFRSLGGASGGYCRIAITDMRVPIRRFTVVDSNARSRGQLASALEAAAVGDGPPPLIPDALVVEMMKAKGSARAWAKALGPHSEHFGMARPPGSVIRDEIEGEMEPSLVNQSGTAAVRRFVEDYRDRGEAALDEQMEGVEQALEDVRSSDTMFNVGFIREVSQPALDDLVSSLPSEDVEVLRGSVRRGVSDDERWEIKSRLVQHPTTLECVAVQVAKDGAEERRLSDLVRRPTLTRAGALLTLAEVAYLLEHQHVVRGLADKTLLNDAVDGQGVLLSAVCDDFLTEDTRSKELHRLVRSGMGLSPGRVSARLRPVVG